MMFKMRTWGGGTHSGWVKKGDAVSQKQKEVQQEESGEGGSMPRGEGKRDRKEAKAMGAGVTAGGTLGDYREGGGGPRNPGCGEIKGSTSVEGGGTGGPVRGLQGGAA